MECGVHRCPRNCHHVWPGCHDRQLCVEEVHFECDEGHPLCRPCNKPAEEIQCRATIHFPCPAVSTHVLARECWQSPNDIQCYSPVDSKCPQGHVLQRKCHEDPTEVARRCQEVCG